MAGSDSHVVEDYDIYEVMGLQRNATQEDIRKAYRKMALKYHPDKNLDNPQEAAIMFQRVNRANQVLSDDTKRQVYNEYGWRGVQMYEQMGEQNFAAALLMGNPWFKFLFGLCCLLTGCCCCFCCCCCCGMCAPKNQDNDTPDIPKEDDESTSHSSQHPSTSQQATTSQPAYTEKPGEAATAMPAPPNPAATKANGIPSHGSVAQTQTAAQTQTSAQSALPFLEPAPRQQMKIRPVQPDDEEIPEVD